MKKFGFIGVGNMGGALAEAVAKSVSPEAVMLADRNTDRVKALAEKIGCRAGNNESIAANCDYIFLGVKPQIIKSALEEIAPALRKRKDAVLVSMAAGVQTDAILNGLGVSDFPLIRIMPNMPASVGRGMILYCTKNVKPLDEKAFTDAMAMAGTLDRLEEKLIDAGSAVSGCGPAFAFLFLEALADGGVACGLPRDKALLYAAKTLSGSAELLILSGKHPGELKDAVCSPAGSTIEGVRVLENEGIRSAAADAVIAAYKRTLELGK